MTAIRVNYAERNICAIGQKKRGACVPQIVRGEVRQIISDDEAFQPSCYYIGQSWEKQIVRAWINERLTQIDFWM